MEHLRKQDPAIAEAIGLELERQRSRIGLIASENAASPDVMAAMGTVLTNKYAEGYPGSRYYGGCEYVDLVEEAARERARSLFGAEHANVQPHSGAQANMAVYFAALKEGDTVMGMDLSHGGHLTHGSPAHVSGRMYRFVPYGVHAESHRIDYDEVRRLALRHKPRMIVAGASAYPRRMDFAPFAEIARETGALLFADMAHIAGLVAAGQHPNPVPWAHFVTATTHKTLRGPRGGLILCRREWAQAVDKSVFPAIQGGPFMHMIAAKAVAFGEAARPSFAAYIRRVLENARVLAEALMEEGLDVVSGGTDTHLLLVDLKKTGIDGKEAQRLLDGVGLTVNKNTVPFDPAGPRETSGIRIGTPAATTRGMGAAEMREIGRIVSETLRYPHSEGARNRLKRRVRELAAPFPLFAEPGGSVKEAEDGYQ